MKQIDYISTEEELRKLAEAQRKLAYKYAKIRNDFGQARWEVMLLLTPHLAEDKYRKASAEKQILMLLSDTLENHKAEVYGICETYTKALQQYKGLERILDANSSRISAIQSLLRYAREND